MLQARIFTVAGFKMPFYPVGEKEQPFIFMWANVHHRCADGIKPHRFLQNAAAMATHGRNIPQQTRSAIPDADRLFSGGRRGGGKGGHGTLQRMVGNGGYQIKDGLLSAYELEMRRNKGRKRERERGEENKRRRGEEEEKEEKIGRAHV